MYQLLLADDERTVLDGLQEFIDWNALGFEVAGAVQNIADALQIIEHQHIDVLLTDIVMDEENGFDLVAEATKIQPSLKFVVLSGYSEFDFAIRAIQLGCINFLTKPIDFDQCNEVFKKLALQLEEESSQKDHKFDLFVLKRERFFRSLLEDALSFQQIHRNFAQFFPNTSPLYCLILFQSDGNRPFISMESITSALHSIPNHYLLKFSANQACCLVTNISTHIFMNQIQMVCEPLFSQKELFISMSSITSSIFAIPTLFQEAQQAMRYRHIKSRHILSYDELSTLLPEDNSYSHMEKQLNSLISSQQFEKARELAIQHIISLTSDSEQLDYSCLIHLVLTLNQIASSCHQQQYLSDYDAFMQIIQCNTQKDILDFFQNFFDQTFRTLQVPSQDTGNYIINAAQEYMNTHLQNNLSLSSVAEAVYVSPSYLSRLFVKVTGQHFSSYLTSLRMELAKSMLGDLSLKIYDISTLVGYESPKHFSRVFQEYTGCTPSEYRDKL
ncbi:MAG: response regulator transcription factor [Massiliimalia sp.]